MKTPAPPDMSLLDSTTIFRSIDTTLSSSSYDSHDSAGSPGMEGGFKLGGLGVGAVGFAGRGADASADQKNIEVTDGSVALLLERFSSLDGALHESEARVGRLVRKASKRLSGSSNAILLGDSVHSLGEQEEHKSPTEVGIAGAIAIGAIVGSPPVRGVSRTSSLNLGLGLGIGTTIGTIGTTGTSGTTNTAGSTSSGEEKKNYFPLDFLSKWHSNRKREHLRQHVDDSLPQVGVRIT
jgi:hypothetical protein